MIHITRQALPKAEQPGCQRQNIRTAVPPQNCPLVAPGPDCIDMCGEPQPLRSCNLTSEVWVPRVCGTCRCRGKGAQAAATPCEWPDAQKEHCAQGHDKHHRELNPLPLGLLLEGLRGSEKVHRSAAGDRIATSCKPCGRPERAVS